MTIIKNTSVRSNAFQQARTLALWRRQCGKRPPFWSFY